MKDIFIIAGTGIISTAIIILLKQYRPEFAFGVALSAGIIILFTVTGFIFDIFEYIDFDTFDEYKADLKAKIEKRHEATADNAVEEKLVEALIEKLEADIPEAMFVNETENFLRDYDNNLRMSGLDLKTYMQYTGMKLDALRAQMDIYGDIRSCHCGNPCLSLEGKA